MKKILLVIALGIGLNGCYPGDSLTTEEVDVVATNFDEAYFETNVPVTYHLPDTVGVIGGENEDDQDLTRDEMDFILAQVRNNLDAIGYVEIDSLNDEDELPDVVITVDAIIVQSVGVGCIPWWGWWGWYPWWPGWGWGAGGCYPTYAYSFTTGSLLLNMIDVESSTSTDWNRVWVAGINGLIRNSQQGNQEFVRNTVNQAFDQSPYLTTSN
jgi:hypothetical protein